MRFFGIDKQGLLWCGEALETKSNVFKDIFLYTGQTVNLFSLSRASKPGVDVEYFMISVLL